MSGYFGSAYFNHAIYLLIAYAGLWFVGAVIAQILYRQPGASNPLVGALNCWMMFFLAHFIASSLVSAFALKSMAEASYLWHKMLLYSAPLLIMVIFNIGLIAYLFQSKNQFKY